MLRQNEYHQYITVVSILRKEIEDTNPCIFTAIEVYMHFPIAVYGLASLKVRTFDKRWEHIKLERFVLRTIYTIEIYMKNICFTENPWKFWNESLLICPGKRQVVLDFQPRRKIKQSKLNNIDKDWYAFINRRNSKIYGEISSRAFLLQNLIYRHQEARLKLVTSVTA